MLIDSHSLGGIVRGGEGGGGGGGLDDVFDN